jgi:hypothetical protein
MQYRTRCAANLYEGNNVPYLVVCGVAVLNAEVIVFNGHVDVRQNKLQCGKRG